jgi:hypothetical protein
VGQEGEPLKFIKPKDMRSGIIIVAMEDCFADAWLARIAERYGEEMVVEDDIDCFRIDGGGMVCAEEPETEFTIEGCRITTFLRQAEFVIPGLRRPNTSRLDWQAAFGRPFVIIRGRWTNLLLTVESAAALADAFETDAEAREPEVKAYWDKMDNAAAAAGVHVPNRQQVQDRHGLSREEGK